MNADPLCPQQHTHPKHDPNRCIFCEYGAAVRADALDAAREAVAGLPEVAGWTGELAIIRKPIALDAIDALRERP